MDEDTKTFTVDASTVASRPGRVKVNLLRWIYCRPRWALIWAGALILFSSLIVAVHWLYAIPAILILALNWFYWRRVKEHFALGCTNPAKVVSLNPTLIAVYTDLSCGGSTPDCHTIKVQKNRHLGTKEKPVVIGDKVVTVSLYSGHLDKDRWYSFEPIPVLHATNDLQVVRDIEKGIENGSWDLLDHWLNKISKPYKVGLYAFDQGNDIPRGETQDPPPTIHNSPKNVPINRASPWH